MVGDVKMDIVVHSFIMVRSLAGHYAFCQHVWHLQEWESLEYSAQHLIVPLSFWSIGQALSPFILSEGREHKDIEWDDFQMLDLLLPGLWKNSTLWRMTETFRSIRVETEKWMWLNSTICPCLRSYIMVVKKSGITSLLVLHTFPNSFEGSWKPLLFYCKPSGIFLIGQCLH